MKKKQDIYNQNQKDSITFLAHVMKKEILTPIDHIKGKKKVSYLIRLYEYMANQ